MFNINTNTLSSFHFLKQQQANSAAGINNAIVKLLNDPHKRSIALTYSFLSEKRAYLNPYHPFYLLIQAYSMFDEVLFQQLFDDKGLSPYCRLLIQSDQFVDIRSKVELQEEYGYWHNNYKKFSINLGALGDIQQLLTTLLIHAQDPAFNSAVSQYHHDTGFTDNLREYIKYVEDLYKINSRLLIVRVDLSYSQDFCITDETFYTHTSRFLKRMQSNPLFNYLEGYVAKLEHGFERGYHVHLMLFYNSAKKRGDIHLGKMIGELWRHDITKGQGSYFNCNTDEHKATYPICFLGRLQRDEQIRMNCLKEVGIRYLVKIDEYQRLMKPYGKKLLSRGKTPMKQIKEVEVIVNPFS
ncbi:inovirus Gp2 family protein [Entomomonas sp. E2T0]|uniref:inovirus Gp2 family protein n=1 Tax=Entomomonas sp. E2T0 TaxID=2930213 RepID=UPI0022281126|nr:inovirus Gp2 family protein [Entomomonas sp. E2T0]UYZ85350.1 inovirus Gp2 family protein [Entomomonas sp. E2T0]